MEVIGSIYYLIVAVPGVLQVVTFSILFGLLAWTKKFTVHRSAAALIGTGILLSLVGVALPYWALTHLLLAGIGIVAWSGQPRVQAAALAVAVVIYGLSYYEMAEVKAVFHSAAIWHIGARGAPGSGNPPERLVELKFGANHDQVEGRFSDHLADYLIERNVATIPVEFPIYYSWGAAHAMGNVRVGGKEFPTNGAGYASWSADRPAAPFPKYFFGLRGLFSAR